MSIILQEKISEWDSKSNNLGKCIYKLYSSTAEGKRVTSYCLMCHFLVAVNSILGELGNGVDGSLFADDLVIYITTKNQRVISRSL